MSNVLTKVQEIYFDIADLINSNEINGVNITCFQEFETLREFLLEQHRKLAEIEEAIEELTTEKGE